MIFFSANLLCRCPHALSVNETPDMAYIMTSNTVNNTFVVQPGKIVLIMKQALTARDCKIKQIKAIFPIMFLTTQNMQQ